MILPLGRPVRPPQPYATCQLASVCATEAPWGVTLAPNEQSSWRVLLSPRASHTCPISTSSRDLDRETLPTSAPVLSGAMNRLYRRRPRLFSCRRVTLSACPSNSLAASLWPCLRRSLAKSERTPGSSGCCWPLDALAMSIACRKQRSASSTSPHSRYATPRSLSLPTVGAKSTWHNSRQPHPLS